MAILSVANHWCGRDLPCWSGAGDEEYKKMQRDKKRISLVCKFCMVPIAVACVVDGQRVNEFALLVKDKECSDVLINAQVKALAEDIGEVVTKNIIALIMTLCIFAFEAIIMIRSSVMARKKRSSEKFQPQVQPEG